MKVQIVLDRNTSDLQAIATLLIEYRDSSSFGFVPVASAGLYSAEFEGIVRGWQALAGLLASMPPAPMQGTKDMLSRYQMISGIPKQTVIWVGGG